MPTLAEQGGPVAFRLFAPARHPGEDPASSAAITRALSHKALDYKMIAIVHISLSGQFAKTLSEFEAAVKRCPNVLVCYLMSGEYDYILRVAAKRSRGLRAHPPGLALGAAACGEDQFELCAARNHRPAECRALRPLAKALGILP